MYSMKEKARYVCGDLFSTPARVHDGKPGHEQSITKENTGWKRKQILSRRWGWDAWRGGMGVTLNQACLRFFLIKKAVRRNLSLSL